MPRGRRYVLLGVLVVARLATAAPVLERRAITVDDLVQMTEIVLPSWKGDPGIAVSPDGQYAAVQTQTASIESNSVSVRWKIVPIRRPGPVIDAGDGGEVIYFVYQGIVNGNPTPQLPLWSAFGR